MIKGLGNFIIVSGHYGTGKTNFAVNLAKDYAKQGKVTIVDMDLVNPYFRTSDYKAILEEDGIEVITPVFGATNLDIPSLPAAMYGIFEKEGTVIIDVGGDDVGSTVLGRFYPQLKNIKYDMLYVVNRFRSMTVEPAEAVQILSEIEAVTHLKATAVVNNSHLMSETTAEILNEGYEFAKETAGLLGLPLIANTLSNELPEGIKGKVDFDNIYPIDIYVKPGW